MSPITDGQRRSVAVPHVFLRLRQAAPLGSLGGWHDNTSVTVPTGPQLPWPSLACCTGLMDVDPSSLPDSQGGALVRLGLKLALGKRGEYLAEYLEQQSSQRIVRRLKRLGEMAEDQGLSSETLFERVRKSDDAAEYVDEVVDMASRARYQPKLKYLAKCLAAALATADDAIPDMAWAKIQAVRDLDSMHVRLLHAVKSTQERRSEAAARRQLFHTEPMRSLPAGESVLIEHKGRGTAALPTSSFHAIMAVLVRNGLVATEQDVAVDVDVELDIDNAEASASPSTVAETMYRVTGLGLELLEDLSEAE